MENFENNGCSRSCAEKRTGEATYAHRRKCENALELRGNRVPAEHPGQAIARELIQWLGFEVGLRKWPLCGGE